MAHPKVSREGLRRAYVFGNQPLELAAIQCGVSVHSSRRWKKETLNNGDNWELIRSAYLLARVRWKVRAHLPNQSDGASFRRCWKRSAWLTHTDRRRAN